MLKNSVMVRDSIIIVYDLNSVSYKLALCFYDMYVYIELSVYSCLHVCVSL